MYRLTFYHVTNPYSIIAPYGFDDDLDIYFVIDPTHPSTAMYPHVVFDFAPVDASTGRCLGGHWVTATPL